MRSRCLIVLVFFMVTASSTTFGRQNQRQTASGTASVASFTPTDTRQADGNTIVEGIAKGAFTGTFNGTFVEHLTEIIHPGGDLNFHGQIVFTGTVDGCGSGTVIFHDEGTGSGAGAFSNAHAVTVDLGTVDVHANLEFTFVGFAGTYTGTFQCH
jgi:hypothetical protein